MITISIPDGSARMLALLLHRLTWDDVLRRSEDKLQCEQMLFAAEETRQAIERAGAHEKDLQARG